MNLDTELVGNKPFKRFMSILDSLVFTIHLL